jgi:hypothetical protein
MFTWKPIYDLAKEGSRNQDEINMYCKRVESDIGDIEKDKAYANPYAYYALKASSFGANFEFNKVRDVVKKAKDTNLKILFDAETSQHTIFEDRYIDGLYLQGLPVYKTYQMYRSDAMYRLLNDLDKGIITHFKIVRGAYMESEPNKNILLPTKEMVDESFNDAIKYIMSHMKLRSTINLMIATHNEHSVKLVEFLLRKHRDLIKRIEFAQLMGMADSLTEYLHYKGYKTCKYVPYGTIMESLPYLSRRLFENYKMLQYVSLK